MRELNDKLRIFKYHYLVNLVCTFLFNLYVSFSLCIYNITNIFSSTILYLIEFIVKHFNNHGLEDISRNIYFLLYSFLRVYFGDCIAFRIKVLAFPSSWSASGASRERKKKNAKRRWSALAHGHVHAPGKALSCVLHRAMERNATAVR